MAHIPTLIEGANWIPKQGIAMVTVLAFKFKIGARYLFQLTMTPEILVKQSSKLSKLVKVDTVGKKVAFVFYLTKNCTLV